MLLEVENVRKKYGQQMVLDHISFSLEKGEIVGFLGPNGAGKTTTMKIITGCLYADSGSVRINHHRMSPNATQLKAAIGYLPENNPLYDHMYVSEYLLQVLKLYPVKYPIKERVKEIICQTGLQSEAYKTIGKLSKGYRQRVGLAQAIIHHPTLLILDEPTSGLDPNQINEMKNLLLSLSEEKGILFSSHILSDVASICTRIIIIHRGIIVADKHTTEINDLEGLFKIHTKR